MLHHDADLCIRMPFGDNHLCKGRRANTHGMFARCYVRHAVGVPGPRREGMYRWSANLPHFLDATNAGDALVDHGFGNGGCCG